MELVGTGTQIVRLLGEYPDKGLPIEFLARKLQRPQEDLKRDLVRLSEDGIVEITDDFVRIKK